jgi:hypothetical protein
LGTYQLTHGDFQQTTWWRRNKALTVLCGHPGEAFWMEAEAVEASHSSPAREGYWAGARDTPENPTDLDVCGDWGNPPIPFETCSVSQLLFEGSFLMVPSENPPSVHPNPLWRLP